MSGTSRAIALEGVVSDVLQVVDEVTRARVAEATAAVLCEVERQGGELPPGLVGRAGEAIGARARVGEDRRVRVAVLRALARVRKL